MHHDSERISYLDLWIIKEGNQLYTDLYTKPTDRNTLLKADSYHPLHLKNSLPYSQLCRVKRICTRENDFDRNAEMMLNKFRTRGYKENTLTTAKSKIDKKNRDEFLKTSPKKSNNSIVFTTKYTKSAEKYKGIVLKHWHILTSDKKISHLYKEPPKVVFKRGRNLGDILTASDLIPTPTASQTLLTPIPDGNYKCGACAQLTAQQRVNILGTHTLAKKYQSEESSAARQPESYILFIAVAGWDMLVRLRDNYNNIWLNTAAL